MRRTLTSDLTLEPSCSTCRWLAASPSPCGDCVQSTRHLPQWEPKVTPLQTPPDTNPKTRFGLAKTPMSLVPAAALVLIAESFRLGAEKYGPANWRAYPVSASTYLNAAQRHLAQWIDGEELDPESGVSHLAHAAACLCILMDAQVCDTLKDDRPPPAPTGDLLRRHTKPL